MSGTGRGRGRGRRGRGRARGQPTDDSDGASRLSVPAGGFDGPASRGSGSATSGRVASTGSGRGTSPGAAQAASQSNDGTRQSSTSAPQSQGQRLHDPALDPSRVPRATDTVRNVDLPASFFNVDRTVSTQLHLRSYPAHSFYVFFELQNPPDTRVRQLQLACVIVLNCHCGSILSYKRGEIL
jgi:hypothetical protein